MQKLINDAIEYHATQNSYPVEEVTDGEREEINREFGYVAQRYRNPELAVEEAVKNILG